jgi:CubicO group peptidase (beta-lactamase class C family)
MHTSLEAIAEATLGLGASGPGATAGVFVEGEPVFMSARGYAQLDHSVPNTCATRFRIASLSKQFTVAAALGAEREGRLSLDEPIGQWLPELPSWLRSLSLSQAMRSVGGVPDFYEVLTLGGGGRHHGYTEAELFDTITRFQVPMFPPGSRFRYSNTGFLLAGWILERALDTPLEDILEERVFRPAGMEDTSLEKFDRRVIPRRATPYTTGHFGSETVAAWSGIPLAGQGGVVSTVTDLARWEDRLTSADGIAESARMECRTSLPNGDVPEHGMGRFRERHRGDLVYHAGALAGCSAFVATLRSQRMSVCVLANTDAIAAGAAARRLLAAASNLDVAARVPAMTGIEPGVYEAHAGGEFVEIIRGIEGLEARFLGRPKALVTAEGRALLVEPTYYGISLEQDGESDGLLLRRPGEATRLRKAMTSASDFPIPGSARFAHALLGIEIDFQGHDVLTRSEHGTRRWRLHPVSLRNFRLTPEPMFVTDLPKLFELGGWSPEPLERTRSLQLWTPLNLPLTFCRL